MQEKERKRRSEVENGIKKNINFKFEARDII